MPCTKTGCHVYLEPYNSWAYGDAFEDNNLLILRLVTHSHKGPVEGFRVQHFTVYNFLYWFDDRATSVSHPSTMISHNYVNHGYEGIPI